MIMFRGACKFKDFNTGNDGFNELKLACSIYIYAYISQCRVKTLNSG